MIRSTLKAALPRRVVQLLRNLVRLESGARTTYLRMAWRRRWAGWLSPAMPASGSAPRTIVTVCHGNILRSPYAEALLKRPAVAARVPGLTVSSAGLHAFPGKGADPRGVTVAEEQGIDMHGHRATLLDAQIVAGADLLLVMDHLNAAEIVSRYPHAAAKVVLLGSFDAARPRDPEIPDPYMGDLDAVRSSYARVAAAIDAVVERLARR